MNWAKERAEEIVTSLPYDKGPAIEVIAAELQRVADECAEVVDVAPCYRATGRERESTRRSTSMDFADDIRARFPKEAK